MPYKDPAQRRAAQKRHYERNRASILQKNRTHYASLPQELKQQRTRAKHARYRQTAKGKAMMKAYNHASQEKRNVWKRRRRQTHHAEVLQKARDYTSRNRDMINARRRASHAIDPARRCEEARQYAQRHPEKIQARFKRWYGANVLYNALRTKIYRRTNPEKPRIWNQRRRARKLTLPDTFTEKEWSFARQYWHHACAVCGNEEGFFWTLAQDHWIPLTSPQCPGTVAENILPLCHGNGGCNNVKKDSEPFIWLASQMGPRRAQGVVRKIEAYFAVVRLRKEQSA